MDPGYVINTTVLTPEQAQAAILTMFGTNPITEVSQQWFSHGPLLQVGQYMYFKGNASNPRDMCGNDSLKMKILGIRAIGTCPSDGTASYILIPDEA
jgi:hypothetical protein